MTGGAKRIGQAIAIALAGAGYDIAIHYNSSRPEAQETAALITRQGVRCEIFPCDLQRETAVRALIRQVQTRFPDLNVLINSASLFRPSGLSSADLPSFHGHFSVNLIAPYLLSCEFARLCKTGHIINLLDTDIVKYRTSHFPYLLSKKALAEFTQMAAVALAPKIRVNGICPGLILPPADRSEKYLNKRALGIPLKRRGDPRQIAKAALYLLESEFLTGQFIFNDGGEHLI